MNVFILKRKPAAEGARAGARAWNAARLWYHAAVRNRRGGMGLPGRSRG